MIFHRPIHLQSSSQVQQLYPLPFPLIIPILPTTHDFRVTVMSCLLKLVPVTHSIKQSTIGPIPNQVIRCTREQLNEQRSRNYSVVTIERVICSFMQRLTPTERMMRKNRAGPKSWRSASFAVRHTAPHFKLFAPLRTVGRGFVAIPLTLYHLVIPNASLHHKPNTTVLSPIIHTNTCNLNVNIQYHEHHIRKAPNTQITSYNSTIMIKRTTAIWQHDMT